MPLRLSLPLAVQLVVDDVGWREGWRLDAGGGPYRAGLDRLLGPADYEAIAGLGQALRIRPSAAMVLCEWDRTNVCARQPTATAAGAAWDNRSRAGAWSDAAADLFRERAAHLELALHGVGHEHWENGVMARAEWYSHSRRKWAWADLLGHLRVFRAILDQHDLGPAAGHRLPLSFVPCAFQYLWDEADDTDTGALAATAGVRYASTPFSCLDRRSPLAAPDGGVDHGVLVVDRGASGVPWDAAGRVPAAVHGAVADGSPAPAPAGCICGIHWPNLLSARPEENGVAVGHWTEYLRRVGDVAGQVLAANAREAFAQWAWHRFGRVHSDGGSITVDLGAVPLAVRLAVGDLPVILELHDAAVPVEQLALPPLRVLWVRRQGRRQFAAVRLPDDPATGFPAGPGAAPTSAPVVLRDGTFNVLDLRADAAGMDLRVEVFGCQRIPLQLRGFRPGEWSVAEGALRLLAVHAEPEHERLFLTVSGHDIQGETGTFHLSRAKD